MTAYSLGCWKYDISLGLISLDGQFSELDGSAATRVNAFRKCANIVIQQTTYSMFALHSGECLTADNGKQLYRLPGQSDECPDSGKGATNSLNVYGAYRGESIVSKYGSSPQYHFSRTGPCMYVCKLMYRRFHVCNFEQCHVGPTYTSWLWLQVQTPEKNPTQHPCPNLDRCIWEPNVLATVGD